LDWRLRMENMNCIDQNTCKKRIQDNKEEKMGYQIDA
jgi:hypothetical protein